LKLENYFRLHFDKSCPEHASKFRESYVVRPFGSCVNGLSLHNSDLDISVTATVPQNLSGMDSQIVYEQLRDLFKAVPNRPAKFKDGLNLPKLSGNKFPLDVYGSFCHPYNDRFGLIQLTSLNTKFELVITKTPYQINNSRYLSAITSLHPTIHAYLMLIKSILSLTGLKGANKITSYGGSILAIFYLNHMNYLTPLSDASDDSQKFDLNAFPEEALDQMIQWGEYSRLSRSDGSKIPVIHSDDNIRNYWHFNHKFDESLIKASENLPDAPTLVRGFFKWFFDILQEDNQYILMTRNAKMFSSYEEYFDFSADKYGFVPDIHMYGSSQSRMRGSILTAIDPFELTHNVLRSQFQSEQYRSSFLMVLSKLNELLEDTEGGSQTL